MISLLLELLSLSTITLSTAGPKGEPHAAPVFFASRVELVPGKESLLDGLRNLELYFFSDRHSQHIQDLEREPLLAVALYPETPGWQDIRGLQARGRAEALLSEARWEAAWETYLAKFPFVSEMKSIVASNTFYVFRPTWLRLLDNRRGFGFKDEWNADGRMHD